METGSLCSLNERVQFYKKYLKCLKLKNQNSSPDANKKWKNWHKSSKNKRNRSLCCFVLLLKIGDEKFDELNSLQPPKGNQWIDQGILEQIHPTEPWHKVLKKDKHVIQNLKSLGIKLSRFWQSK